MTANSLRARVAEVLEKTREDDELEHRLLNFMHGRHLPERESVQLDVHGGVVVISGRLRSLHSKWLCVECCRHVAGVIRLVDELEVDSLPRRRTTG